MKKERFFRLSRLVAKETESYKTMAFKRLSIFQYNFPAGRARKFNYNGETLEVKNYGEFVNSTIKSMSEEYFVFEKATPQPNFGSSYEDQYFYISTQKFPTDWIFMSDGEFEDAITRVYDSVEKL